MGSIALAVKKLAFASRLKPSSRLEYFNMLFRFSGWIHRNLVGCPHFADRSELYSYLNREIIGPYPIDYLEFGVYEGETLGIWIKQNQSSGSHFFGFDSFEGLPEDWSNFSFFMKKGTFSTEGKLPVIGDRRVRFVKGLFQVSLGEFLSSFTPRNKLVIHCDADLYSSTLYVLASLDRLITTGTIIVFDEFDAVLHEFKAFHDYLCAFNRKVVPLAFAGSFYNHMAVKVVA
ncbi:MAG: macrocin O-methyltransferase [bacterium]|nr:macrocin O-methyltransferase [bacterium]